MSADKELKAFIDRVLRMKEEQDAISADIRDIYAEAKMQGYDKTAMGKVVAYLRKIEKSGHEAATEQEMLFDTYLNAYEGASGTPVATHTHEAVDRSTGEVLDRDSRRRQRTSESMDDTVAMSAQMLADGLISEEGHRTTVIMANAVATKLGNGVITPSDVTPRPDTAVTTPSDSKGQAAPSLSTHSPETAEESPRKAAEAVPERAAQFQAKASDEAEETGPHEGRAEASVDASTDVELVSRVVDGRTSTATSEKMDVTAGETAQNFRPAKKTIRDYRPHCMKPDACASNFIDRHCYSCEKAAKASEVSA